MSEGRFEQLIRPEAEKGKEGREKAQETVNEMVDHVIELRNIRLDLQAELNSLSLASEGAQDEARIEKIKTQIAELDKEITGLDDFFKWVEEQNDLEIVE